MAPVEGGQQRDDVRRRIGADPELAALEAAAAGEDLLGLDLGGVHPPGHLQEPAPEVGQLDAAAAALEEAHAVARLQGLHLAGEGRLADVQHLRRPAVAAGGGDRVKGADLGMIHRHSLYNIYEISIG